MNVAAEAGNFSDVTTWINWGVLGLMVLGFITGWIWTKPSVEKIQEERDRAIQAKEKADAQRDAMAQVLQDKLLPVVGDFIQTTRALMPVLQQLQTLQQMIPIMQELLRTNEVTSEPKESKRRRRSS